MPATPPESVMPDRAPLPPAVLREARPDDIPGLVRLINQAFRVESPFVTGERTNAGQLETLWARGTFFVADAIGRADSTFPIAGCVYSERRGDGRGDIGMRAVDPARQGEGLGRRLMEQAEQRCRDRGCTEAVITVINLRTELFPLYRRLGYEACGTEPYLDVHRMLEPLHFIVMRKSLV
jgi:GNAT superfamily N-acetyltransferase